MLMEFTVVQNEDHFKERVEAENETEGRAMLEEKYGTGCCPYPCKVIFVPKS